MILISPAVYILYIHKSSSSSNQSIKAYKMQKKEEEKKHVLSAFDSVRWILPLFSHPLGFFLYSISLRNVCTFSLAKSYEAFKTEK